MLSFPFCYVVLHPPDSPEMSVCETTSPPFTIHVFSQISEVPKLSSYAKAEDKLFKYLFGDYQKWVRPVDHLNQTIRVKFGLAISQLVDVVRIERNWLLADVSLMTNLL